MRKISTKDYQKHLLNKDLLEQLNPEDPLLALARKIDWGTLEKELAPCYSEIGRPAKNIRLMAGLLMLKHIENLSDERVVEQWVRNPYFQAFCGEQFFQWKFPCDPSDLTYFRRRLGKLGSETIFAASVVVHGKHAEESEVVVDTTVQEKNIAFPTDTKLHAKIIGKCVQIAKKAHVKLRRSYKKELRERLQTLRFHRSPKNARAHQKARQRIKTMAGAIFRDVQRKLSHDMRAQFAEQLAIFEKVLQQKKDDKRKIYSLHEPQVACIAKGKAHKKYEFGSKAGLVMTKTTAIIVGVSSFEGNPYDGDTLTELLAGAARTTGVVPQKALCDRGFKGREKIGITEIRTPVRGAGLDATEKQRNRKDYGRRSAIEPVIGHVKHDHRLARCLLKGALGDAVNLFMAATAFNLKKWMRKAVERLFFAILGIQRHFTLFRLGQVDI